MIFLLYRMKYCILFLLMKSKKKRKFKLTIFPEHIFDKMIDYHLLPIQNVSRTYHANVRSWIDVHRYDFQNSSNYKLFINSSDKLEKVSYNSLHIPFFPTIEQINILDKWFELYRKMLNM